MTEEQRKDLVRQVTRRILKTLEGMDDYSKLIYLEKLVDRIDETYLQALGFAFEMTPDQPTKEENNQ